MALDQTEPNIQPPVARNMARRRALPVGTTSGLMGIADVLLGTALRVMRAPVTSISPPGSGIFSHSTPRKAGILGRQPDKAIRTTLPCAQSSLGRAVTTVMC